MCPFTHIAMPAHIDIVSVYHCSHAVRHRECTTAFRKSEMQHWSHETTQVATMANWKKSKGLTHKRMFNNSLHLADALCTCLTLSSLLVIVSASVFDMAMPGLACLILYVRITKRNKKTHRGSPRATLGHRHRRAAQGRRPRGPGEDRPHRLGAPPPPWGPGLSAEGPGRGDRPHRLGAPLPPCGPG